MPGLGFFKNASQNEEGLVTKLAKTITFESTFPAQVLQQIIDAASSKHAQMIREGAKRFKLSDLQPSAEEIDGFIKKSSTHDGVINWQEYESAVKAREYFSLTEATVSTPFEKSTCEKLALFCHTDIRRFYMERPNHVEEQKALAEESPAMQPTS